MIKRAVSFPLTDKHVVNENHVIQKSHDATQKNMSSRGAFFNVPRDWFETNSRHQKHYSEGSKKNRGCRGLLGSVICVILENMPTSRRFDGNTKGERVSKVLLAKGHDAYLPFPLYNRI